MATIASKRKLNTKSIKDKHNALKEVEDGSRKSLQSTVYQRTLYLLGEKIRIKVSKPRRKEATENTSDCGRALL